MTDTLCSTDELLVVSPYVVAEVDYLVASRQGADAELAVLGELTAGAWELATVTAADLAQATEVVRRAQVQRAFGLRDRIRVLDGMYVALAEERGVACSPPTGDWFAPTHRARCSPLGPDGSVARIAGTRT